MAPAPLRISQGSRQGETLAWPGCPPFPLPRASSFWGRGKTQRWIFPPAPSSSLWPFSLSRLGLAEAKENRASQLTLTLSLPHFLLQERWFTPSPTLAQDLALVSRFLQSFQKQRPRLGSAGPSPFPPFHPHLCFPPSTQGPVYQSPHS